MTQTVASLAGSRLMLVIAATMISLAAAAQQGPTTAPAPTPAPAPAPAATSAAQPDVDLKLFETGEVDRSKGCSVALWQANRKPESDRFAYIFTEVLTGTNHVRQPARIRIGSQTMELNRVATGGKSPGYGITPYQLYRIGTSDDFVILDLKLADIVGQSVTADSGTMSIIMRGKQVFRASVKGVANCTTAAVPTPPAAAAAATSPPPAAPTPPPAPAAAPPQRAAQRAKPAHKVFIRYPVPAAQVAREITEEARKKFDCKPQLMRQGVVAYSLSEEAALWQMTCDTFAYQGTSIYAVVYASAPGSDFQFLTFKGPPGKERSTDPTLLMTPKWDVASRTVSGLSLGRGSGDCGTLERHRFTEDREFVLVEYREKENCDGKEEKPENWPLVFRGR